MTPRIIVEGMDGAGKSTLAAELQSFLKPSELVKNELGPRPDLETWWKQELRREEERTLIYDRFFYPEFVYGPILRGKVNIPNFVIEHILTNLRQVAFLIYCRPDTHTIKKGSQTKEQWPGVNENFLPLLQAYDTLMMNEIQWYGWRFFRYDWENTKSLKDLKATLVDYLEDHEW